MAEASVETQGPLVYDVQDSNGSRICNLEDREPLLSESLQPESSGDKNLRYTVPRSTSESSRPRVSKSGRELRLRRTSSDQDYPPNSLKSNSSLATMQTTFLIADLSRIGTSPPLNVQPASRPSRSVLRRSSSNSFSEMTQQTLALSKNFALSPQLPSLEWDPNARPPLSPLCIQRTSSQSTHVRDFKWYPVRSVSDSSTIFQIKPKANVRGKDIPLKPCMKQKSKSATTTPSSFQSMDIDPDDESKKRKAKSVDFEKPVSKRLSLPLLRVWAAGTENTPQGARRASLDNGNRRQRNPLKVKGSCPMPRAKGRPADSAITRTDVHVVAVAPPLIPLSLSTPTPPKTPTMQIVESKTGRYEVIWDDVAEEEDIRGGRRASSASESLQAASSTGTKGLQRVNSKLEEWSWLEGQPTAPFMPQIVVYPDMDSHNGLNEAAAEDECLRIYAPPNTARTSRSASNRDQKPEVRELFQEKQILRPRMRMVAKDAAYAYASCPRAGSSIGASRGARRPIPIERRLSNMPASNVRFRGHRDSMALARYRILHAAAVPPELDTRGSGRAAVAEEAEDTDIIEPPVAGGEEASYPGTPASEPLPTIHDELTPPSTPRPTSAVQSLKASISTPMLVEGSRRHIRILG